MSKTFKDGEPCDHPGCASHITHPCEGCGRIGARNPEKLLIMRVAESTKGMPFADMNLREHAMENRAMAAKCRKAYNKPPMSDACEFLALAYDKAAEVFEIAIHDLEMAGRISKENADAL